MVLLNVKGEFVENYGTPQARPVHENSFLVIDGGTSQGEDQLKAFLKREGNKFGQDSVMFKSYNKEMAVEIGTRADASLGIGGEKVLGTWHPNKIGEFCTIMKGGRSFVFGSANFYRAWSYSVRREPGLLTDDEDLGRMF